MKSFEDRAEEQGWNDRTQVKLLLDFARRSNTLHDFDEYAAEIAAEENDGEDVLCCVKCGGGIREGNSPGAFLHDDDDGVAGVSIDRDHAAMLEEV
jgi:hypothetical protein